jgi:hypothetical protein
MANTSCSFWVSKAISSSSFLHASSDLRFRSATSFSVSHSKAR